MAHLFLLNAASYRKPTFHRFQVMDVALEAVHIFGVDLHSVQDDFIVWKAL